MVTTTLHAHPQSPQFAGELSEAVMRLVRGGIGEAEIRLNPAELGPLKLSVQVRDNVAQVQLMAQHPVTREALESALPRLREMFAEQGMHLADASVGDGRGTASDDGATRTAWDGDGEAADTEPAIVDSTPILARGLVDCYA